MTEGPKKLAAGIHDNHGLKLWHEWQPLTAQNPQIGAEWRYEQDDDRSDLTGPSEMLTRTADKIKLSVTLGGNGRYTPRAELADRQGVTTAGPGRIRTSAGRPQVDDLFEALALAEEAAGEVGKPDPPDRHRRGRR